MTRWLEALGITLTLAFLALPAGAHAQRVEPAGAVASDQPALDSLAAARLQRCKTGYAVRGAIGTGLVAALVFPYVGFLKADPGWPVHLLAVVVGAGVGAARGSKAGEEKCAPVPRLRDLR